MSTWWLSGKENPKFWNENWHIFVFKQWPKSVKTTLMVKVEFELKTWHMPQIKNNWSDRVLNWNNDKCYLCSLPVYLDGKTLRKITISLDQWLITINPIVLFPCLSLTNLSSSLYNNPAPSGPGNAICLCLLSSWHQSLTSWSLVNNHQNREQKCQRVQLIFWGRQWCLEFISDSILYLLLLFIIRFNLSLRKSAGKSRKEGKAKIVVKFYPCGFVLLNSISHWSAKHKNTGQTHLRDKCNVMSSRLNYGIRGEKFEIYSRFIVSKNECCCSPLLSS